VVNPTSPKLVKVLRSTLECLETSEDLASDDPALAELKGSLLSSITELEVAKNPKPPLGPQKILWIAPRPGADPVEPIPPVRSAEEPLAEDSSSPVANPVTSSPDPQSRISAARSRKNK
jgi:hypothetical protein